LSPQQGADEGSAAADVDPAVHPVFELLDGPGSYGPTISELRHAVFVRVEETTYFAVSFMNGAARSSDAVRRPWW